MALFSLSACGKTQVDDNSKVVKIAVAAPMTGDNAEYGIGFANAADLMAEEWNEKGGVEIGDSKYKIEIVKYDDKSDSDEAKLIAEKIASDKNIWGVIGHFASGICMVAAPHIKKHNT